MKKEFILEGFTGFNSKIKTSASGKAYTIVSLANGKEPKTDWFTVIFWGKEIDIPKGARIEVSGYLGTKKETRDGKDYTSITLFGREYKLIPRENKSDDGIDF